MGKRRNSRKLNNLDWIMIMLIMPIVLLAAFPILWIPVGIFLLSWFIKKISEILETITGWFPQKTLKNSVSVSKNNNFEHEKQNKFSKKQLQQNNNNDKEKTLETPYDNLFDKKIIYRGRNYYLEGKFNLCCYNNFECNAVVGGNNIMKLI